MGCGDDVLDIATGGISAAARGDIAGAVSGGATSILGNGYVGQLVKSNVLSLASGGYTNIAAASKYDNFASQMDVMADDSRVNDKLIRKSGVWLEDLPYGHEARGVAPMVMSTVGGIYGGPVGAAAGYYFGNKIKGGDDNTGMIGGAIAAGGSMLGSAATAVVAPAISSIASNLIAQGVTASVANAAASTIVQAVVQAAVGSGVGAMSAAAQGGDPGEGAEMGAVGGAISGGISGAMNTYVKNLSDELQESGMSKTEADAAAKAAIKGSSAYMSTLAKNAALGTPSFAPRYTTTTTTTDGKKDPMSVSSKSDPVNMINLSYSNNSPSAINLAQQQTSQNYLSDLTRGVITNSNYGTVNPITLARYNSQQSEDDKNDTRRIVGVAPSYNYLGGTNGR